MTIDRCECPVCRTSYTAERCGLTPAHTHVTVICAVCKTAFDLTVVQEMRTEVETSLFGLRRVERQVPVERLEVKVRD